MDSCYKKYATCFVLLFRSCMLPLCLQGYVDAARMFEQEFGPAPGVELGSITHCSMLLCPYTLSLCLQGYVDAARMFEQESGTAPGVELGSITDRMEVRKAVQSGQVEEAIDKVNDMNPEVRHEL
jgi:hypothetical protein